MATQWYLLLYGTVVYALFLSLLVRGFSVPQPPRRGLGGGGMSFSLLHVQRQSRSAEGTFSEKDPRSSPKSVEKLPRGGAHNKKTALKWVVQSIERFAQDAKFSVDKPSPQLLDALHRLQRGMN